MSDRNARYEDDALITLSKSKLWLAIFVGMLTILTAVGTAFIYMVRKNDSTFTSPEEKYKTLNDLNEYGLRVKKLELDAVERDRKQLIFGQVQMQMLQSQQEMKDENKENFSKVGQDLEQIKNKLR